MPSIPTSSEHATCPIGLRRDADAPSDRQREGLGGLARELPGDVESCPPSPPSSISHPRPLRPIPTNPQPAPSSSTSPPPPPLNSTAPPHHQDVWEEHESAFMRMALQRSSSYAQQLCSAQVHCHSLLTTNYSLLEHCSAQSLPVSCCHLPPRLSPAAPLRYSTLEPCPTPRPTSPYSTLDSRPSRPRGTLRPTPRAHKHTRYRLELCLFLS